MISEKDAAARRRKIKLSAYILFHEKGVDGVTFRNIAAYSGISESSIYHYFPKKSYLMLELNKYLWREIAAELREYTVERPEFQNACGFQQIDWLIDAFEHVHFEHLGYLKFALECKLYWIRKKHMVSREEYGEIISPVFQQFSSALQKGVEDKSVFLNTDFESCCFLLWGILSSYLEQMVILDALYGTESNFRHYFKVMKISLLKTFQT